MPVRNNRMRTDAAWQVWEKPVSQEFLEKYRAEGFSDDVIHRADGMYCGPAFSPKQAELWIAEGWILTAEYPAGVDNLGIVIENESKRWK